MSFLKKIKTNIEGEEEEKNDGTLILAKDNNKEEGEKTVDLRKKAKRKPKNEYEEEEVEDGKEDEEEEEEEEEWEDESDESEDEEEEEEKERKKKKREKKEDEEDSPKKEAQDWIKSEGQLAVDVYHTGTEFCIQAPIAGVSPDDLDISVENEMVVIKGVRNEPEQGKEKNYFYKECYWGPFSRQIILPEDVDIQRIKASLKKGVLMIKIPRVKRIKKKKINVVAE